MISSNNINDCIVISGWTVPKHRIAAISPVFPFSPDKYTAVESWNIKVFVDGMVEPIILSYPTAQHAKDKAKEILCEATYVSG